MTRRRWWTFGGLRSAIALCMLAIAAPAQAKRVLTVLRHDETARGSHGYLAFDKAKRHAVLVDAPAGSAARFLREIKDRDLTVGAILLTHAHGDHTGDLAELASATGVPILHFATPWALSRKGMALLPGTKIHSLPDNHLIEFGALKLQMLRTPGHTDDSVSFHDHAGNAVFVGDTIQANVMGGSEHDPVYVRSLRRLSLLPPETRLFAGHGVETTIGNELPWIRSVIESAGHAD